IIIFATAIVVSVLFFFFFKHTPTPETYTLSLHDALPISLPRANAATHQRRSKPAAEYGADEPGDCGPRPQRRLGHCLAAATATGRGQWRRGRLCPGLD